MDGELLRGRDLGIFPVVPRPSTHPGTQTALAKGLVTEKEKQLHVTRQDTLGFLI